MNVQESILREKIDPYLTSETLTSLSARALAAVSAPKSGVESAGGVSGYQVLTGGCWNRVIGVVAGGHDLVIKISPHRADRQIIREFDVLKTFRDQTDLPVPEPLLLDAESLFTPGTALVMTRVPGVVMHECFGMLGGADRRRVTEQIAGHLGQLHSRREVGFGGVELAPETRHPAWADFWLPRFDRTIDDVGASGVAPRLIDSAREIRPELAPHLDIGPESTMCHYDIWSGNVMIDLESETPRVSGYIDIPGHFADYARELSFAMMFGIADQTFFEVYTHYHDLDPGFELRSSIYNLKMNLKHVQMYPSETCYQVGAAECLQTIYRNL